MIVVITLSWMEIATAQQVDGNLQSRSAELEIQKLELEVARLKEDLGGMPSWLTGLIGLLAGIVGTATSVLAARRARLGALDQCVHEKRLESYPGLVKAAARLAVHFPTGDQSAMWISPKECREMGQAMSKWYFESGGLLLSVEARDAYFRLARALTRASLAKAMNVPAFPQDVEDISVEAVEKYRVELALKNDLNNVEDWSFGEAVSEKESPAQRFRDFVFLQRLSSTLRTALSKDIRSRRRPS